MPIFAHGESKDKLSILYYLNVCGLEVTREQLYTAMVENDCMSFFPFEQSANELEEDGYIVAIPRAFGQGYRVTVRGEEILSMFSERLPYSYRLHIKEYADKNREKMRLENQLVSSMEPEKGGTYRVQLTAQSSNAEELSITMHVATREMAIRVRKNWPAASEDIYMFLLEHLLKDGDSSESETDAQSEPDA